MGVFGVHPYPRNFHNQRQRISRSIREAKTIRVALAQRDDDDDVPLLVAHLGSLYVACAYGHDRSYKSLGKIFARFDRHGVDRLDAHGHAPLSHACAHGNPRAASLLLDRGASPEWRSVEGTTLLMLACSGLDAGHVDVACLLLNRGADLAAVTVAGETALHLAAYALLANGSQKTNMVRLLLASGADLEARSRCGVSPADVLARWLVVCRRPGGAPDPADSARRRVVDDADLSRIVCAYLFAGGDDRDGSRVGNLYTLPAAVPEAPRRLVAAEVEGLEPDVADDELAGPEPVDPRLEAEVEAWLEVEAGPRVTVRRAMARPPFLVLIPSGPH